MWVYYRSQCGVREGFNGKKRNGEQIRPTKFWLFDKVTILGQTFMGGWERGGVKRDIEGWSRKVLHSTWYDLVFYISNYATRLKISRLLEKATKKDFINILGYFPDGKDILDYLLSGQPGTWPYSPAVCIVHLVMCIY